MQILEVRPGLFALDIDGLVNAYVLRDSDAVTLVDTGVASSADPILRAVADLAPGATVERVILTHCHADHIGAAAAIQERTGAAVLAHPADAPVMDGREPEAEAQISEQERPFFEAAIARVEPAPRVAVDAHLRHGDTVPGLTAWRAVHAPGHTPGSIALYHEDARLLITGDAVASMNGSPIIGVFNVDPAEARRSFLRLAELDSDAACFGHGAPLIREAGQVLRQVAEGVR